jgi:hypothetical protein
MKILVIGGLGYIGSDLSPKLRKFADVDILDTDVFSSDYTPEQGITSISLNVLNFTDFDQYDKVVIASDIDCEEFYNFAHYRGYLSNYQKKLVEIANSDTEVYYLYGYLESAEGQKQFVEDTIDMMSPAASTHLLRTPEIYGDNVNVRGDKIINKIVRDFMIAGKFVLNIDPAEIITFAHISQYTDDLVECIVHEKAMPQYDRLPALLLVNAVHWALDSHTGYTISIGADVAQIDHVDQVSIRYTDGQILKYNINMMFSAIDKGLSSALLAEHSDRAHLLNAAMLSYGMTSKLLST